MAAQPVIVEATSGRSKCKACVYKGGDDANPTIEMGSKRVGIPGHAAGVTVYHWCHPKCFAQWCLSVDLAPTGRARCKADGTEIVKGACRLRVGYKKESTNYKVENASKTIVPELIALVGRPGVIIHGLSELSLEERLRVERLIFDDSRASSVGSGGAAGSGNRGNKRRKSEGAVLHTAATAKKARIAKAKKSGNEEAKEEGEICD